MALVTENERSPKCLRCHKASIKIVSLTDDRKGRKICQSCKKEIRKINPHRTFNKVSEKEVN